MSALHSKPRGFKITLDEYEKIFKQYYAELCTYAASIVGDKGQAEEIVQELFTNLWSKRQELHIQSNIKAYLMRAVKNNCMMYFRSKQNRRFLDMTQYDQAIEEQPQAIQHMSAQEIAHIIDQTLNAVPERWKEIFSLIRFEGYKYREVAEKLSISVKTVEKTMGHMLKLFRNNLVEYLPVVMLILTHL